METHADMHEMMQREMHTHIPLRGMKLLWSSGEDGGTPTNCAMTDGKV